MEDAIGGEFLNSWTDPFTFDAIEGLSVDYKAMLVRALADEGSRFQTADEFAASINALALSE